MFFLGIGCCSVFALCSFLIWQTVELLKRPYREPGSTWAALLLLWVLCGWSLWVVWCVMNPPADVWRYIR